MANSRQKCTGCKQYFSIKHEMIKTPSGKFHSFECMTDYASSDKGKKRLVDKGKEIAIKEERRELKARKEALRKPSWYLEEAQRWFNKFVRLRDYWDDCISCDRTLEEITANDGWKVGGSWDCGHYLSRGAYPELRFMELNAHKQCKSCNAGSGKYTKKNDTVSKMYRVKLIEKIGLEKVEWLEGPHKPVKYTIDDLKLIIETYKFKCKALEAITYEERDI
ncbi:TPA: recombination protein NinG [Vibrio parahaemolyticus]|uniref:recombination protein NinG n=1 Tax=Vibrio parahaemolyticus TaxID=670 RepID=UPI000A3CB51B|nr:recombination protein NinG [Vibrio parahaemolyticus]OUJ46272.1 hypothetical protein BTZ53_10665 [Vibrio parahaemolyticus]HDF8527479.1 recombination protein NinG [Vibrio parahaemolyticus]